MELGKMKVALLLSILLVCGFLQSSSAIPDQIIEKLAKIAILTAAKTISKHETIDLLPPGGKSIDFKNMTSIAGILACERIYVHGLDALQLESKNITFELNSEEKQLNFGLNILIPSRVGINIGNYFSDVGISNSIPVYGAGNLTTSVRYIRLDLDTLVKYDNRVNVTNIHLRPDIGAAVIKLTGFWNNEEFSEILSGVLTTALDVIGLLWKFELDLITCILSSVIEGLLNHVDIITIIRDLKEQCSDSASLSSYAIIRDAFNGDLVEFIQNPPEEEIVRHIERFVEYLTAELELLLM